MPPPAKIPSEAARAPVSTSRPGAKAPLHIEQPFRSSRHAHVQPLLVTRDLRANDHSPQSQIVGSEDTSKEVEGVHPKMAW